VKQKWATLSRGWSVRPTQDGLELIGPERNLALELSDPEIYRKKIASILLGSRIIREGLISDDLAELLVSLNEQRILEYRNEKPPISALPKIEQILWKIRSTTTGTKGPIGIVYRLKSVESNLSRYLFAAVYESNGANKAEWAGGSDKDPLRAELKAIMEALERWASGVIPEEELILCSSQRLKGRALDPRQVIAYKPWQYLQKGFRLTPFSATRDYFWKEVLTFPEKKTYYLPADCIYYPVPKRLAPNPYTFANSSGIAAAFSFQEAIAGGIYEAIERDAFMLTWLNQMKRPRIKNATLPEIEKERIRELERLGYELYFVDLTLDLTPVILAIAVSYTRQPALILGAASHFNLLTAISKALGEVEHQFYWRLYHADNFYTLEKAEEVKIIRDHMALYTSQKHLAEAEFLWQGSEISCYKTPSVGKKQELERLIELLESIGKTLVIVDLTPKLLKELGIWVVRCFPLGLVPISFGHGMEPLAMPRIREFGGKKAGWGGRPYTHPFA